MPGRATSNVRHNKSSPNTRASFRAKQKNSQNYRESVLILQGQYRVSPSIRMPQFLIPMQHVSCDGFLHSAHTNERHVFCGQLPVRLLRQGKRTSSTRPLWILGQQSVPHARLIVPSVHSARCVGVSVQRIPQIQPAWFDALGVLTYSRLPMAR